MPRIIFSGTERLRMNAILKELDPATHEFTSRFANVLSSEDWNFVQNYARAEMRGALEMGLLARSVAEVARQRGIGSEQGVSSFLDSTPWMRNFGVSDDADERFKMIADLESPLFVAVDALLQLAQDRMFNTLDEEYARLLDASTG